MQFQDNGNAMVLEKGRELIEALRATAVIEAYQRAEERFRKAAELRRVRADFERVAGAFQRAQGQGTLTHAQIREAREVQARLQRHPLVQEFLAARDAAGRFLQEVNRVMSEVLGVDVGATAGPAGGAC